MPREIRADYETQLLLPPSLENWVPDDHPARFLREIVDMMDLDKLGFKKRKSIDGRPNYASDLLLKVWLYGYMDGIRSTRKLERACRENISLIWLTGNNAPDHNTLWRFFRNNKGALKGIFKQVSKVATDAGLIGMVLHAVDGTKLKAKGSRESVLSRKDVKKLLGWLDDSVEGMIGDVERNEKIESGEYRLPEELSDRESLRETLKEVLGKMDEIDREHFHPVEPEARMMNVGGKVEPAYNAQVVSDSESGMIVAEDVVNEENDRHQLTSMLDEVERNTGAVADETVADAGYYSADELSKSDERNRSVLVNAHPALTDDEFHWSKFTYDEENDCVVCPMGNRLEFNCVDRSEKEPRREYRCKRFRECEKRFKCSRNRRLGRRIRIGPHHAALLNNIGKLRDENGREALRKRKGIVENVFGIIKECYGFRRWTVWDLDGVKTQWSLMCTAFNLKKLYKLWNAGQLQLSAG